MSVTRWGWVWALAWASVAGAQVHVTSTDERFGVPNFAWAQSNQAPASAPVESARRYLLEFARPYRLSAAQISRAEVVGVHDLHDGSAVVVTFSQRVEHVPVFLDEVKVIMTAKGQLVAISGHLAPTLSPLGPRRLTAQSALQAAWAALEGRSLEADAVKEAKADGTDTWLDVRDAREPARTRAVWFARAEGLMPAWRVELAGRTQGLHSFIVSAVDGQVLFRNDLTASHSYLVFADPVTLEPLPGPRGSTTVPSPGPTTPAAPFVAPTLIDLQNAGLSTNDPWLAPSATETRGNNVIVAIDLNYPNGVTNTDEYTPVSAPGTFQWPANFGVSPRSSVEQSRAGAVHLFYVTNYLHDVFYDDGFDERSRNAQTDNFGRGGLGNDALEADALDWSWANNATMATPADGRRPRMTNFLWYGFPDVDGAFDTGVVAHEWGHYISNRLIGDGDGLSTQQARSLGEGWGDFHAALVLATEADAAEPSNVNWSGAWPLANWVVSSNQSRYFGVRRWPLSSSFAINPLTFRHILHGEPLPTSAPSAGFFGPNEEVHNAGEVWVVALWECYTSLLVDPRFTFPQARARMRRRLVAGYKATPLLPTYTEARDAMLAVAAASDPLDFVSFWNAFARRGLGFRALAPWRFTNGNWGTVEDFSVGAAAQLSEPTAKEGATSCDGDGVLDVDERGLARVRVRNLGTVTMPSVSVRFSSTSPSLRFPAGDTATVTNLAPFDVVEVEVEVALSGRGALRADLTATATAANIQPTSSTAEFLFNTDEADASSARDDVEAEHSTWVASATPTRDPGFTFSRRRLTATQHVWWSPSAASTFEFFLTSPPLPVGASGLRVNFKHRFDFDREGADFFDGATIELSTDDGATWLDVGSAVSPPYPGQVFQQLSSNPLAGRPAFVGQSPNYPTFNNATLDLAAYANQTVRLRFRSAGDDSVHQVADGWELDELEFLGLTTTPFSSVVADPNRCSNQPPVANAGPDLTVDEGARVVLAGTGTDPEGEPVTLRWQQTAGPVGVLQGDIFIAPEVQRDTPVTLTLVVNDGRADSAPDEVALLVRNVNRAPTVTAPLTKRVEGGAHVTLTAVGRDGDGDALTYAWAQEAGPPVQLEGAGTSTVAFDAPAANDAAQQLVMRVTVSDGVSTSAPARVTVTVDAVTPAPPGEAEPSKPPRSCSTTPVLGVGFVLLGLLRRRSVAPQRTKTCSIPAS